MTARMRRTIIILLCILAVTGIVCTVLHSSRPAFPPDAEAVNAALEESGLEGELSETETVVADDGRITYVIRSRTKTYSDMVSPEEAAANPSTRWLIAGVTSGWIGNERALFAQFDHASPGKQMKWEDWEEQIVFASLLYGKCKDQHEIYDLFSRQEIPDGEDYIRWEAGFSGGFCVINWSYSGPGSNPKQNEHAMMTMRVYESKELYQSLQRESRPDNVP